MQLSFRTQAESLERREESGVAYVSLSLPSFSLAEYLKKGNVKTTKLNTCQGPKYLPYAPLSSVNLSIGCHRIHDPFQNKSEEKTKTSDAS